MLIFYEPVDTSSSRKGIGKGREALENKSLCSSSKHVTAFGTLAKAIATAASIYLI